MEGLSVLIIDKLVKNTSGWLNRSITVGTVIFVSVVGSSLPLLESVSTLDHLLFECSVLLLVVPQSLFFLLYADEGLVWLMLVLLSIYGFKVPLFSLLFLQVKFPFEINVGQIGVDFDDVVPELFLLVVGLLDFPNGEVGGCEDTVKGAFEGLAH
jgi:hypothetical protein